MSDDALKRQVIRRFILSLASFSMVLLGVLFAIVVIVFQFAAMRQSMYGPNSSDASRLLQTITYKQTRDLERQRLYIDYTKTLPKPKEASDMEKTNATALFDKAFRPELTTCVPGIAMNINYEQHRIINRYANRIIARDCSGNDILFFINRSNEWQMSSQINIIREFPSRRDWLVACYIDDILPIQTKGQPSSQYIADRNLLECEYIAKYGVVAADKEINTQYEQRFGGR